MTKASSRTAQRKWGDLDVAEAPVTPSKAGATSDPVATAIGSLIEAALAMNHEVVRQEAARLANLYRGPTGQHLATRIKALLKRTIHGVSGFALQQLPVDPKSRLPLLEEEPWPSEPLLLEEAHERIIRRFIDEALAADRLAEAGLATRANLLLVGPPGTGKSLIAGHIAARLGRPLRIVRLDTVVSSLLGDTAKNIRAVFDSIGDSGFLFLDEMDAVAKKRDDVHEVGELKRVVNTLLQGLDSLDSSAVLVAATNHAHLLDPAIWRRFPTRLTLDLPSESLRASIWLHYLALDQENERAALALARASEGMTGSDIREHALAARRHAFLTNGAVAFDAIATALLGDGAHWPTTAANAEPRSIIDRLRDRGLSNEDLAALNLH